VFYGPTVSNTIGDTASTGFSTAASYTTAQADSKSAFRLRDGFPAVARAELGPGFGAAAAGQKAYTSVGFFEPDRPTPISYQYNANVQRETRGVLLEVGYLANVSHHLTGNDLSLNQVAPERMGAGDAQARRPFPQFTDVYWINPAIGNSTYHAGTIKAERRFGRGASFLAHYTFSKFLDDVASSNEYGDPQSYMDAYNRRLDKGRSGTDVPQRVVVSTMWETPEWKGRWRWAGGWQTGVSATLQSGAPFTVVTASNTTNAFTAGPLRPNLVGDVAAGEPTLARYFNTAAFAAPAAFAFGNAPRSVLRGPGQQTVDATLTKTFAVTERWRAELHAEAYNLLNRANFDPPAHTFGTASFGVIQSARAARALQLGARVSF